MMELLAHPHHKEATMLSMSQALKRIKGATAAFVDAPLLQSLCRQLRLGGRQRLLTNINKKGTFKIPFEAAKTKQRSFAP
jgi:hypothetical protein